MLFTIFITVTILQRIVELIIAKKNERFMKSQGALEFGQSHYPFIVAVHSLFFVSYILEVSFVGHEVSSYWPILFPLFLLTQAGRIWALKSLGPYWNTKIIVLPNARIIRKGPYRFFKHPNYIIVSAEFLIIPLMFEAYITTALFTIMNIIILAIRIPAEENALKKLTAYEQAFSHGSSLTKI
ncbi:isoprenylcysteine carboxylmethyltransferase family protein [Bacillus sp. JJ1532]|uniref:isoprenylcysteine carboxyl methyltransferase family protein n=2 Tax=Bacillus TaxID=1386 RepID=UPI002FFDAFBB